MITYDPRGFFYSTLISDNNMTAGFTTREIGDMQRQEAAVSFFKTLPPFKTIIWGHQRHSTIINTITQPSTEDITVISDGDGQVTSLNGTVLTVGTADCVPIIFADKIAGIIGVSHQGWRGTYDEMAPKMIETMIQRGAKRENIVAAIGPSINSCCYEVYGERLQLFSEKYSTFKKNIFREGNGKTYLNLIALNYNQLVAAGLKRNQLDFFPFCTSCNEGKFWSYRRDGKILGEMACFIFKKI